MYREFFSQLHQPTQFLKWKKTLDFYIPSFASHFPLHVRQNLLPQPCQKKNTTLNPGLVFVVLFWCIADSCSSLAHTRLIRGFPRSMSSDNKLFESIADHPYLVDLALNQAAKPWSRQYLDPARYHLWLCFWKRIGTNLQPWNPFWKRLQKKLMSWGSNPGIKSKMMRVSKVHDWKNQ